MNSHTEGQPTPIRLRGRFDTLAAPDIRADLEAAFAAGSRRFVIDLSDVTFMDSAALAVLVSLMKRAKSDGGDVALVRPESEEAVRILRLTRFDRVFTFVDPS